ncbi:hypothetical protein FNV43_RR27248 [Rhamnella rubrinervis]|uniref:Uncharacterized protein n=1 Tax=Rhamnella rubrinervis TaxID=2594499 RepID=A0A8K0GPZ5_9ROSA|nr:hypothetical protein FNV43_RR27248 [Rhamnella rubrinervis]
MAVSLSSQVFNLWTTAIGANLVRMSLPGFCWWARCAPVLVAADVVEVRSLAEGFALVAIVGTSSEI